MKRLFLLIAAAIFVIVGLFVYRVYPRHVSLLLKGIEYQAGSPKHQVRKITLQMNGTLHTSLFGKRTFDGTVTILGATVPNRDNGKSLTAAFNSGFGSLTYFNRQSFKYYTYGAMFTNNRFNEFTITEYNPNGSGWSGRNGLTISAPAHTRTQALQISNDLMVKFFDGRLLK